MFKNFYDRLTYRQRMAVVDLLAGLAVLALLVAVARG